MRRRYIANKIRLSYLKLTRILRLCYWEYINIYRCVYCSCSYRIVDKLQSYMPALCYWNTCREDLTERLLQHIQYAISFFIDFLDKV